MKKVIDEIGHIKLIKSDLVYLKLIQSIVSQQLSVKAADTIFKRFLAHYGDTPPTPQQILDTPIETMRAAGLSRPKASYLHNVARFEIEEGMGVEKLEKMSNDEAIVYLTRIKGVGRWTVEMLLMFVLAREDVFAIDDIGLQNAMVAIYKLNRRHKRFKKQVLKIADAWSPYRTYASIYLWRSLK